MRLDENLPASRWRKSRRYIGRQRIVDAKRSTVAFELLYRRNRRHSEPASDHPNPSQDTLDCSVLMGLDTLCGARLGFFNCNREVLIGTDIRLLPANRVVLEILEDVKPEPDVLKACRELRDMGFELALDDFLPTPLNRPFLEFVTYLKVDVQTASPETADALAQRFGHKFRMVAEKVETPEELSVAVRSGFELFQGFLFGQPEVFSTPAVSPEHIETLRYSGDGMRSLQQYHLAGAR